MALRPVTLQGSVFGGGIPRYMEPRLVKTVDQGRNLAELIGDGPAAFMRGHGIVVVGPDVEQMLYAALVLEDEARKAVEASALGEALHYFTEEDCRAFDGQASFDMRSKRAWHYYTQLEHRWDRQPGTGCVPFC